jgi:hypothetical protein
VEVVEVVVGNGATVVGVGVLHSAGPL